MKTVERTPTSRSFRVALTPDGCPGPIEERIGRRLVRLVDPQSEEGRRLLDSEAIEWVGPDGDSLGRLSVEQAYDELFSRLERMLDERPDEARQRNIESCLERLKGWVERVSG
jgi:hypothetical protein